MTLDYDSYVSQLSNLMVIPSTDPTFTTFLPGCIDYAEQRIYRELDLMNTRTVDATGSFNTLTRDFALPTTNGSFVVVESMNAISAMGDRTPMVPVTKEYINAVYGNTATTGTPQYFATITSTYYLIAPTPDDTYTAEVIGTIRPTALSSSNTTTLITQYVPDLFMAASMIFAFGFQRDFGGESDDPKSASSWEQQYQNLLQSAVREQLRTRFEGAAWTPMADAPIQPPRV